MTQIENIQETLKNHEADFLVFFAKLEKNLSPQATAPHSLERNRCHLQSPKNPSSERVPVFKKKLLFQTET